MLPSKSIAGCTSICSRGRGDLKSPGNQLEKLKDDRAGQHAIRINDQYRACFIWADDNAEQVEVTDYH